MTYDKPLPRVEQEPYARPFWEGAREERLLLQHCPDCDRHQFFPRPFCMHCGGEDIQWTEASGSGTVYSYTIVRQCVRNPEFADEVPYCQAFVDLEEGPRMCSTVVDCPFEEVRRGLSVQVVFDHVTAEVTIPRFEPA